ncbi:MAG: serine/threonine-protein kinase [Gemmataceae bacterium]
MNPPIDRPGGVAGLAREIRSAWMDGTPPDAQAALAQHPALAGDRSAVLELAYEEFCLRREAGEALDAEEFCARFPQVRTELRLMLSTDQALAERRSITRDEPTQQLTVWPSPGDDVGHCRLLRELGRGAFSRVYLARERSAGDRPVALKLCRAADVEARTLGRLHHPHIMPILWAGRDESWALDVVCMPFLGSVTLADLLARLYPSPHSPPPGPAAAIAAALEAAGHPGDPDPDLLLAGPDLRGRTFAEGVARLALPLAEALEFLHGRGLYHCDLKPSNLLLTPRGRPLLLDFNLSRADGVTPRLVGGTFQYMAPEQLRVHADRRGSVPQTAQADLFSLGVILYELLTGRAPFGRAPAEVAAKDLPAWLLARMPAGAVPLSRLNPYVPSPLTELIGRCLDLDPKRRPTTDEVVRALRPRRSRPAWTAVAAACGLVVAVAAMGAPWGGQREAPNPEPPVVDSVPAERSAALAALEHAGGLIAAGRREEARPALRDATARFRRLLDLHQQRAGPAAEGWKDQVNQAYTLLLLGTPADAAAHLADAEEALRDRLLRAAAWSLTPAPALASLPALADDAERLGQVFACRAFCSALQGRHVEAILFGRRALGLGRLDARVLNNLGYCELVRGDLAQSRNHLAQALCLEPQLCQALFNACQVAHREGIRNPEVAVPGFLLDDLEAAMALRQGQRLPEPAELYRLAAQVYARAALDLRPAAGDDPAALAEMRRREQRAREYLDRGCVLGLDAELVSRDDFLRQALGDDGLQPERLRALRQQDAVPVLTLYLADPLGGPVR